MKTLAILLLLTISLMADPGVKMTPERQARIDHTIRLQRKILKLPSPEEEKASLAHPTPKSKQSSQSKQTKQK